MDGQARPALRPRGPAQRSQHRIEALSHDPRYRFMFGKLIVEDIMAQGASAQIFRLPKAGMPVTIVQLAGLPNEVVNSVVSVLARLAFEVARLDRGDLPGRGALRGGAPLHPGRPEHGFEPTRRAIGRIAKEGRKYGVSLGVVTQRPSRTRPDRALAMLDHVRDAARQRARQGHRRRGRRRLQQGALNFLSSLADREAIAFGEAIATPMRMKFADYRKFETDRAASRPASDEDARKARMNCGRMVSRMRGEIRAGRRSRFDRPASEIRVRATKCAEAFAIGREAHDIERVGDLARRGDRPPRRLNS